MENRPPIDILMATYNGAPYIGAQIDSLLKQNYQDWQLIIRDDGSEDNTIEIVHYYRAQYPDKIHLIADGNLNLGARSNYSKLLTHSRADYIMFCDQDDVWFPQKISITFDKMKALEAEFGQNTPLLVHSDAKVVDSHLQEISPSLWQYQKCKPARSSSLKRLLLQNVATGCTVMINKSLRDMALPISPDTMMHDWWMVLVASAFGHIEHISVSTLLYRQHERNDIGAKAWNALTAFRQLCDLAITIRYIKKINVLVQNQAAAFLERYQDVLRDSDKEMLDIYSHLSKHNYFMRRYYIIKYRFFYSDLLRNIGRLFLA